jgi:small subunit ribosomal protein S9
MSATTAKKPATKKPADKAVAHKKVRTAKPTAPIHAKSTHAEHPAPAPKPVAHKVTKTGHGHSFYAVGKRKTSVAQILLTDGDGTITLNKLPFESYFQTTDLRYIVSQPLVSLGVEKVVNIKGKLHGGGIHSQAESLRHAISRALIQYNSESRRMLKKQGFLTRDPRVKERKKPGLKRARRAPQFSKR